MYLKLLLFKTIAILCLKYLMETLKYHGIFKFMLLNLCFYPK